MSFPALAGLVTVRPSTTYMDFMHAVMLFCLVTCSIHTELASM